MMEPMPQQKMVLVPANIVTALAQMLQQQPAVQLYLALMACKEAENAGSV